MFFFILIIFSILTVLTLGFGAIKFFFFFPMGFESFLDISFLARPFSISTGTLAGLFSKSFLNEIEIAKEDTLSVKKTLLGTFRSRSFWISLTISPLIILGFYGNLEEITSLTLLWLLAYENGFFFRSVFDHQISIKMSN